MRLIYKLFECSPNILRGYQAGKPIESVVYCLITFWASFFWCCLKKCVGQNLNIWRGFCIRIDCMFGSIWQKKIMLELINLYYLAYCERFEPSSHFMTKCQSTISHCQQWSSWELDSPRWSCLAYLFILLYGKIPEISPGAYIFQRPFLTGLFLEGLI